MDQQMLFTTTAALFTGVAIGWGFAIPGKKRWGDVTTEVTLLRADNTKLREAAIRAEATTAEVAAIKIELQSTKDQLFERAQELSAERAANQKESEINERRLADLARLEAQLQDKFLELARRALNENSSSFLGLVTERYAAHTQTSAVDLDARHKAINDLVSPLAGDLKQLREAVAQVEVDRKGAYAAVTEQITHLHQGHMLLRSEAAKLVQALRSPRTRGQWGELQLKRVLEIAGMIEHVDFVTQPSLPSGDDRLRPDVIIKLPGGTAIVVDAKTPLEGYLASIECDDETERKARMADHSRQVREHVRSLSSKQYWNALTETPDFVVMFIPGEAFYASAIEHDPQLFEAAFQSRVLIATPTTLLALVKAIAYGWQQKRVTENSEKVAALGKELHERVGLFVEHFQKIGRALKGAIERYNEGVGSLEARVLVTARKFDTLGITLTDGTLPEVERVEVPLRQLTAEGPTA